MDQLKQIRTKAYVVEDKGAPFVLRDVILDEVLDHEVLVEIKYTGICHTDIAVQKGALPPGSYPAVLGHEGAGIVRHVGSAVQDKSLAPGDAVILSINVCYSCRQCREGRFGACVDAGPINFGTPRMGEGAKSPISLPDGTPVHGQFFGQSSLSKLAVVAERSVVKVGGLSLGELEVLPALGCAYMTGAGSVFNVLRPTAEDTVAVIGAGSVGFAAILAARASGAKAVVAVDMYDSKLQTALSLGATHTVNTAAGRGLAEALRDTFPRGIDRILDTTGVSSLCSDAVKALAHEGTLALVGAPPPHVRFDISTSDLVVGCKRVVGVIEGVADPQKIIPLLVQMYREGNFAVDKICTVYPAGDLDRALEDLKSGKVIKPILSWRDVE